MSTGPLTRQLTAALQKHAVFSLLEGETLARLVPELEMVSFALGEGSLKEGEPGVHRFRQMATVLGAVPARQVLALLDQLESCTFPSGQVVCREGEPGDRMYIIQAGEAKVVKGSAGQETVLAYLGQADYFGER